MGRKSSTKRQRRLFGGPLRSEKYPKSDPHWLRARSVKYDKGAGTVTVVEAVNGERFTVPIGQIGWHHAVLPAWGKKSIMVESPAHGWLIIEWRPAKPNAKVKKRKKG